MRMAQGLPEKNIRVAALLLLAVLLVGWQYYSSGFAGLAAREMYAVPLLVIVAALDAIGGEELLRDKRSLLLVGLLVVALALSYVRGIHFGIEFEGGTRIPLTLEKPVDALTMSEMINNIKNRISTFGLAQVVTKAIGESEIYVELPRSDPGLINSTVDILSRQGKYEGIVDGRVAITNEDIMPGSIVESEPFTKANQVMWEVQFAINEQGAVKFAEVVKGKANYPVFMYLDRPDDSVILLTKRELIGNSTLTEDEALQALNDALRKDNSSIPVLLLDDWNQARTQLRLLNRSVVKKAIISANTDPQILRELNETMGFELVLKDEGEMTPDYTVQSGRMFVNSWRAVGLHTAPVLSPDITEGRVSRFYTISGAAPAYLPMQEQDAYARNETRMLKSILSGGALPVHIIIGTPTTIPAPLGAEFLKYSLIGAAIAIALVVVVVSLRYGTTGIVLPIFVTSFSELMLLVGIIGSIGTIDLGAMAGIIGAIGTGVNAQIVITDEMLAQLRGLTTKKRLGHAFYIIMTNATIAVIAMVPLLFSGLIEIIGFALSVILGMFIGALVTRPAYGAMVERMMEDRGRRLS